MGRTGGATGKQAVRRKRAVLIAHLEKPIYLYLAIDGEGKNRCNPD
jgi:hypothetical protein